MINKEWTILFGIVLVVAVSLFFKNLGLYPVVMDDEYAYSKFTRLLSFDRAVFPDYLYYIVYRITSSCGDSFLNCARLLNILFFVSAAPFIYLIGRQITGKKTALLIVVLSMLGPVNVYTAFFMPESMYFFVFWVFTWFFLRTIRQQGILQWMLLGILLGLAALVKPHAIFLLPAIVALFIVFFRQNSDFGAPRKIALYAIFFAAAIATKFGISFLLAGKSGLTLLGTSYTTLASKSMTDPLQYSNLALLMLKNLRGHLLGMTLLFSVPVAQILLSFRYFFQKHDEQDASIPLKLYAAAVFTVLLGVVAIFTASVAGSGPFETITRLHMRYYNFAFPLLLLVAASQLSTDTTVTVRKWRLIIAVPIGVAIMYAMLTKLAPYTPNFVDSPDLYGIRYALIIFYTLSVLSLIALMVWVFKPQMGNRIFIYAFLPLSIAASTLFINQELGKRRVPDVYDKAGIFTKKYLAGEQFPDILLVGTNLNGMYRALFQLDNQSASIKLLPGTDAMVGQNMPNKPPISMRTWVLIFDNQPLPDGTYFQYPMSGFTLAKVLGPSTLDFKKSSWPGVITKASGFYPAEPWGTWSIGNVTLEFTRPLPEKFAIHLWGFTYGSLIGKEFTVHVGKNSGHFTLGQNSNDERVIELDNPERSNTLTFDIPSTLSPKAAGLGDDDRILGVAFVKLIISPLLVKW
ncbi:MAG TPA: glycosyltransferase family 39 protein [Rhodocyclaceae bacterium]|nr:glycosyltransferase family 39 protein [Rhodocyclaceae bacterium]